MKINIFISFILFHAIIIAGLIYFDLKMVLINLELSYFVSLLIMFSSYQGYKKMIRHSIENDAVLEIKDPLDKLDDPYDLYDEQEDIKEPMDPKELKKRLKKDGFQKMIKTAAGHASWKRLASYIVLVLVFMGLNNNAYLDIGSFLTGLTLGIVTAALIGPKLIGPESK